MGIDDTYLAFCFDETCEHISSFKKVKFDKDGKGEEYWDPKPKWSDEVIVKKNNNAELIAEMQEIAKKY